MLKLLVFTIFLVSSSTFGLLETLFQNENNCYLGCHSNYAENKYNLDACKQGCNYKLHNQNCPILCKLLSIIDQIQASCLVGCSMANLDEHPQSITLIGLSQHSLINNNPVQMFNNMIKQLKENVNKVEKSIDLSKLNDLKSIIHLTENIPIIKSLNEDKKMKHIIIHQEDKLNNYFQQIINNIHSKWNNLIHKQPKIPIWILFGIFLTSSVILWYMIILLCRHTPRHHNLSIHAQELVIEKEKIQPYEVKETLPVKVKLINI